VLDELHSAGIEDDQIRFLCGLGSHGPATRTPMVQKLGEDIVSRYRVYNHNAFSLDNVDLGKTKTWGIDIRANPEMSKRPS
jgi:nickel-dependent lactate racemase